MNDIRDKLIVALDVPSAREAQEYFAMLRAHAGMFKIGSQLFTATGPEIVRVITEAGGRVFLDLKFHDIPNTVAAACGAAARLRVSLLNIHAAGGSEMMRRAVDSVAETAEREGIARPRLLAVTVLTSADAAALREIGVIADSSSPQTQVVALARLADRSGVDGVVASPHEIAPVRAAIKRRDFLLVTPGVRPAGAARDDQKRVMSPAEAIRAGADYIVIGRAILTAPDPARAAAEIIDEMARAQGAIGGDER